MSWSDRICPQVHLCWSGSWEAGTVEPPRRLVDHELVVVARGRCRVAVGDRVHDLAAGGFAIIPPATVHHTCVVAGPCLRHCIHFDWAWSGEPPAGGLWSFVGGRAVAGEPSRPAPDWIPAVATDAGRAPPTVVAAAQRAVLRWRAGDIAAVRGAVLEALLGLFAPTAPAPDRTTGLAWLVKARLDRGGLDELSLRDELRGLGHSYEHLCRCFTRSFGIPPLRYVQLAKVERAKVLLGDPAVTVAVVARRLGYRDPRHFTRVFHALAGTTPGRWRGR